MKPLVVLYDSMGLGLIIEFSSGVEYTNQAGGYSCMQPRQEGIYIYRSKTHSEAGHSCSSSDK